MRVVIAPDSFKESLTATEVAEAIEIGFKQVFPDAVYIKKPVADGGEGSVDALVTACSGSKITLDVTGPLGRTISSFFGLSADKHTAFIEMAAASGIELLSEAEKNPMITTTFGTGELIKAALDHGVNHFVIGIGGSATNDGGVGMMQALGAKLLDKSGNQLGFGGQFLDALATIDLSQLDARLANCTIDIACDVSNPLIGEKGAAAIYGPQKGATQDMIERLDLGLAHYAQVIERDLGIDVAYAPGAGAAGGMGAAFMAFLKAELRPGIEIVSKAVDLDQEIAQADLVITGEGRLDGQSLNGKVPVGVAEIAMKHNCPVIALTGSLGDDIDGLYDHGIDAAFSSIYKICSLQSALENAKQSVIREARNIAGVVRIGLYLPH